MFSIVKHSNKSICVGDSYYADYLIKRDLTGQTWCYTPVFLEHKMRTMMPQKCHMFVDTLTACHTHMEACISRSIQRLTKIPGMEYIMCCETFWFESNCLCYQTCFKTTDALWSPKAHVSNSASGGPLSCRV